MRPIADLTGILLVDKPGGWTSHDVVAKVRGLTGQRRTGHTGTLDPMATGLLVVCLGGATRLVEYMTGHDKRYEGTIALGSSTETDDAEGAVIRTSPVPTLTEGDLRRLEAAFTGEIAQVPPAYSAVKVGGQRAYAAARRGAPLALEPRRVTVHELRLEALSPTRLAIAVHCGPGTYVRSLARDLGGAIGCGAHLESLARTAAGSFSLAQAGTLEALAATARAGKLEEVLLPADEGLADWKAAIVSGAHATGLLRGSAVRVAGEPAACPFVRVYSAAGDFLATGSWDGEALLRPLKVLQKPK